MPNRLERFEDNEILYVLTVEDVDAQLQNDFAVKFSDVPELDQDEFLRLVQKGLSAGLGDPSIVCMSVAVQEAFRQLEIQTKLDGGD